MNSRSNKRPGLDRRATRDRAVVASPPWAAVVVVPPILSGPVAGYSRMTIDQGASARHAGPGPSEPRQNCGSLNPCISISNSGASPPVCGTASPGLSCWDCSRCASGSRGSRSSAVPGRRVPRATRGPAWRRGCSRPRRRFCCGPGSTTPAPGRPQTATRVQETLRARLFDKILTLGPAWFGAERTGGVMLSMVDGVEQLQTFFGQYLPQVDHRHLRAGRDLLLYRVVGSAGRRRHAGRGAVHVGPAGRRASQDRAARHARGKARSSRSARSSSTPCRACRR